MFERPADAAPALGSLAQEPPVQTFRQVLAYERPTSVLRDSGTTRSVRAWARQASGRPTRRLLFALADATDAMAGYCDELARRGNTQAAVSAELSATLGQELAQLRAEVHRLQALVAADDASG